MSDLVAEARVRVRVRGGLCPITLTHRQTHKCNMSVINRGDDNLGVCTETVVKVVSPPKESRHSADRSKRA